MAAGPDEHLLSVEEAAAMLCTPARTVQRWCKSGALPAAKDPGGRVWRINKQVLAERFSPLLKRHKGLLDQELAECV